MLEQQRGAGSDESAHIRREKGEVSECGAESELLRLLGRRRAVRFWERLCRVPVCGRARVSVGPRRLLRLEKVQRELR